MSKRYVAATDLPPDCARARDAAVAAQVPWREAVAAAIILWATTRASLLLIALIVGNFFPGQEDVGILGAIIDSTCQWDCGWYVSIVERGYSAVPIASQPGATSYAFFPVFPLLISAFSAVTGLAAVKAGALVANFAFIGSLVYIYALTRLQGGNTRLALLAVAIICVVPGTFVFSSVYTESTFLFFLAGSLFHFHRGEFWRAGLHAAVLSGVRSNGVLLVAYFVAWIVRHHGPTRLFQPWRAPELFVPVMLAPAGLFAFWTFCFVMTGDAFAQATTAEAGWNWRWGVPFYSTWLHFQSGGEARFWAIGGFAVFVASLLLLLQRRWEEFLLCFAVFILIFGADIPQSLLRYSIALFPVWVAIARAIYRSEILSLATIATLSLVSGCLMVAWVLSLTITV